MIVDADLCASFLGLCVGWKEHGEMFQHSSLLIVLCAEENGEFYQLVHQSILFVTSLCIYGLQV